MSSFRPPKTLGAGRAGWRGFSNPARGEQARDARGILIPPLGGKPALRAGGDFLI